jgi:hypothetical protein
MQTQPIGVACPRCALDIACTVEVKLLAKPGTKGVPELRLVDLADRFAEHYKAAGHTTSEHPRDWSGSPYADAPPTRPVLDEFIPWSQTSA